MVIINGQKNLAVGIIENVNLRILDVQVLINIYIVNLNKEELLIGSNWLTKYKADLILSENKLKFQAQERKFEVKVVNASIRELLTRVNWFREDQLEIISLDGDEDAKTKYIMEEVDDWLNRVQIFRGKEALNELLEQWIKTT